jgi:exodeoxyribonuclease V beta subunit
LKLARLPAGERRITDLKHLLELAQAEEAQKRAGPEAVLEWLETSMEAADDKTAPEAHLRRLEKDGSAVQILTMHGAKGLEFDLVFCPDLWESGWEGMARRFNYDFARDGQDGWVLFDRKKLEPGRVAALDAAQRLAELQEDLRLAYVALTRAKRRVWFLAGWIGYAGGRAATLPSALDWLLRDTDRDDAADPEAWMRRMLLQKKGAPVCEHEAALQRLAQEVPGLVEIGGLDIHERVYAAESGTPTVPLPASRKKEGFGEWRRISYSSLTRGLGEDEDAWKSEEAAEESANEPEAQVLLALSSMPGGKNTGSCLHWILEHWDFRSDPSDLVQRGLGRFGLDLPQREDSDGRTLPAMEQLLVQVLPRLAKARLPVLDASLAEAASEAALSELRFLLPLGAAGLGGEALAAVFEEHGDAALKAYGASLRALPTEAFHGMLEGSIDRLVRVGGRWAVLDWKSNRPGDLASDFSHETLWRLAAEEHYILQLCLYMVVARRFLARRGQGEQLVCGGLAFLRGMDAGLERGLLMLEPAPALLDALDSLFEAGRAA